VTVNETTLEISGEMTPQANGGDRTVLRAERFRGPFKRLVPLPRQADFGSVAASLADGVLTVTVRKRASS
jgi:HSP20 family molecular chaperone IbpA